MEHFQHFVVFCFCIKSFALLMQNHKMAAIFLILFFLKTTQNLLAKFIDHRKLITYYTWIKIMIYSIPMHVKMRVKIIFKIVSGKIQIKQINLLRNKQTLRSLVLYLNKSCRFNTFGSDCFFLHQTKFVNS